MDKDWHRTGHHYVNGVLAATNTSVTSTWGATGPFTIGAGLRGGANTDFFPGNLSDLQNWNYPLSAVQVTALYQQIS